MLWYVIQTYTGREEQLVKMVRRDVPGDLYQACFVVYHEQLWRRQQENQVHIARTFPGYAFILSEDPEELYPYLKKIPAMSKILSDGEFFFLPLDTEEADILQKLLDRDHVIRLSYAATDGRDHVTYVSEPLAAVTDRIERYNFRKRYAVVRLKLPGETREVRVGLVLNDDIRREIAYGKVEAPVTVPEHYHAPGMETPQSGCPYRTGDRVVVVSGPLAGAEAVIEQVRKNDVKINVHFFGRGMSIELPWREVRKAEP